LTKLTFTMLGSLGWKRLSPTIRRTGHMKTLTKRPEQLIDPSSKRSDARLSRLDAARARPVDESVVETAPQRPPRTCFGDRKRTETDMGLPRLKNCIGRLSGPAAPATPGCHQSLMGRLAWHLAVTVAPTVDRSRDQNNR
jgi:hypothetical protein